MDKVNAKNEVEQKRQKNNFKLYSIISLCVGIAVGVVLVAFGLGKLIGYQNEMGIKTSEELSAEVVQLSDKYSDKEDERDNEYSENGLSERYLTLNEELAEIDEEITKASNSLYMREEGWHNPRNIGEALAEAPEIIVGMVVAAVGIVGFFVFRKLA